MIKEDDRKKTGKSEFEQQRGKTAEGDSCQQASLAGLRWAVLTSVKTAVWLMQL